MLEEFASVWLSKTAKYWAIYAIGTRAQRLITITKESRARFQRYEKRRRERPSSSEEYLLEDVQEWQDRVTLRGGDDEELDSDFPETSLGVTTPWRGTSKHQAEKYLATGEIASLECGWPPEYRRRWGSITYLSPQRQVAVKRARYAGLLLGGMW